MQVTYFGIFLRNFAKFSPILGNFCILIAFLFIFSRKQGLGQTLFVSQIEKLFTSDEIKFKNNFIDRKFVNEVIEMFLSCFIIYYQWKTLEFRQTL